MTLKTADFNFELPEELIASRPLEQRDSSRMMVVDRDQQTISHHQFSDIHEFFTAEDLFVLNNTKVVRARYFSDDGAIELVRVEKINETLWRCMVRPGKKMKVGREVTVGGTRGVVQEIDAEGYRVIKWDAVIVEEEHGQLALPHYMQREADQADISRYQTVYAEEEGAIAAPTAGLHFTPEILNSLNHTFLTLHVGVGTFRPVKAENVVDHEMHSERYLVSSQSAQKMKEAKRIVSVGTTVTRVLEHLGKENLEFQECTGETNIFIYPPYKFKNTGALLTNFHLPQSSLMMLVSAFASKELMQKAYSEAIKERYRFFSYGDCMLIL